MQIHNPLKCQQMESNTESYRTGQVIRGVVKKPYEVSISVNIYCQQEMLFR